MTLETPFDVAEFIDETQVGDARPVFIEAFDDMVDAIGHEEASDIWRDGCLLFDILAGVESS